MSDDYLAYFPIGSGSSWGWGETQHEAVGNCIISLKDWSDYYVVNDREMQCYIYFMPNTEGFYADHTGVWATDAEEKPRFSVPEEPHLLASFKTPKHKRYSREQALWSALKASFANPPLK